MDERRDSGEYYPGGRSGGEAPTPPAPAGTVDEELTKDSANPVKSSGIWAAIWGALTELPTGFSSLYDWCVSQLTGKLGTSGGTVTGTLNVGDTPDATVITPTGGVNAPMLAARAANISGVGIGSVGAGSVLTFARPNATTGAVLVPLPENEAQPKTVAFVGEVASAADLRYRIADAGNNARLPSDVAYIVETSTGTTYQAAGLHFEATEYDGNAGWWELYNGSTSLGVLWPPNGDASGGVGTGGYGFYLADSSRYSDPPSLLVSRVLADRTVNLITAESGTSIDIELPAAVTVDGVRRARDFLLDIDNSANTSDLALEFTKLGDDIGSADAYAFVTDAEDSIGEMTTVEKNTRVRLYFTETAYTKEDGDFVVPVFHVARVTLGDFVTSTTGGNS